MWRLRFRIAFGVYLVVHVVTFFEFAAVDRFVVWVL